MPNSPLVHAPYKIRSSLGRKTFGDVHCPIGVYPCGDDVNLSQGYDSRFVVGDELVDDQYEYRILLSADLVVDTVAKMLERLLPNEVYALFEELSFDAFRDSDAYRSSEPVERNRLQQAWNTYGEYLIEAGRCGFGAVAQEPAIEVFIEEHGTIYVACGLRMREEVEEMIANLGLPQINDIPCIENFEHQHRDILVVEENSMMDEYDIKFSLVESLGMIPVNADEGVPQGTLTPFWVHLELDLSFDESTSARLGFFGFGLSALSFAEALELSQARVRERFPDALLARVQQVYRILEDDITDEIAPTDRELVKKRGVWYVSEPEFWA
ncbi:MAG: hypothetical protein ACI97A_000327 [Planctomycetota bacterium]|jgi:hypothetical protein